MVKFRFASGLHSLQHKAERLGWSGSQLLQTEAALIGDNSREQTDHRYVIYMIPLKKTWTIPLSYSQIRMTFKQCRARYFFFPPGILPVSALKESESAVDNRSRFSTTYLPIIAFSSVCVTSFLEAWVENSSCSCLDSSMSLFVCRAHAVIINSVNNRVFGH